MKLRKTIVALLLTLVTVVNCTGALAAEAVLPAQSAQTQSEEGIAPHVEETVWYTRIYNGKQQKRLWSITYQRWLTDWIDIT